MDASYGVDGAVDGVCNDGLHVLRATHTNVNTNRERAHTARAQQAQTERVNLLLKIKHITQRHAGLLQSLRVIKAEKNICHICTNAVWKDSMF